jgi:hypothetical protein
MISRGRPWFAPKSYGYGSGLPLCWQGWATIIVFMAATIGSALLLTGWRQIVVVLVLATLLCIICAVKTKGGWRWRWGDKP